MLRIRKRCAEIVGVEVEPGIYASEQYQREKFGDRSNVEKHGRGISGEGGLVGKGD
jgi:hypothetical protein